MISRGEALLRETRAAAQAGVVTQIVQGRLRSGWSINRVNARLVRQAAGERPAARRPQEAESVQSAEGRDQAQIAASLPQPAEPALQSSEATASGDLEGLSPQVAARLQRVGLSTRAAVEEILAAGEGVFLALPGVGPATLAVVQAWLSAPAPTCVTETETDPQPEEQATAEIVHGGDCPRRHRRRGPPHRLAGRRMPGDAAGAGRRAGRNGAGVRRDVHDRRTAGHAGHGGRLANASVSC